MAIGYPQHLSDEELRLAVLNGGRAPTPGFTAPQGLRPAFVPSAAVRPQPAPVAAPPPEAQLADPAFRAYLDQQGAPKGKKPARDDFDQGRGWIAGLSTFFGGAQGSGEIADRWERDAERRNAQDDQEIKERKAAALTDPSSEQSAAMRQRMGPVLMQMGLKPEEVAGLSAADINQIGAGNLVTGLAAARQKSEATKQATAAKQAALTDQRAYETEQARLKAEQEGAEFDRRNAITAPQALERAQTVGGMATGRMVQGALLQDSLQRTRADEAEGRKQKAAQIKVQRDTEKKLVDEEITLQKLEDKLVNLKPDEQLPGQENFVERGVAELKGKVMGGTGRESDASRLDTDLTAAGLQSYMNTAGNAPNSEREQVVANQLLRGNGTVGSALEQVRQRKKEIAAKKKKLAEQPAAVGVDDDEAGLGIEAVDE